MRKPQRRCRICRRAAVGSAINAYRICNRCESQWKKRNIWKRHLREALQAAYDHLSQFVDTCEICGSEPVTRRLSVDHNHQTNAVRGLLCYKCNYALGWFRDDSQRFEAAAVYLNRKPSLELDIKNKTVRSL